jgi:hypothetical protein
MQKVEPNSIEVEPNSIEAVVLFILYICLQDGKISDKEVKELIVTVPIIQKMYLDIFGEYIHLELEEMIDQTFDLLLPEQKELSGEKVSNREKDFFCNLLTDYTTQDIALLASRTAASADGLHHFENRKFEYWSKRWAVV